MVLRQHIAGCLMKAVILSICLFALRTHASAGDRLPEFRHCVDVLQFTFLIDLGTDSLRTGLQKRELR